jgi:cyclopropane fatty-acyl-phospholipid synthase-like methyltransferase
MPYQALCVPRSTRYTAGVLLKQGFYLMPALDENSAHKQRGAEHPQEGSGTIPSTIRTSPKGSPTLPPPSPHLSEGEQKLLANHGFCGTNRLALPVTARIAQLWPDLIQRGPAYAFFNFLMTADRPIGPRSIRSLLEHVPTWAIQQAMRFPGPDKRTELISTLLQLSLKAGVVGHYDLSNALSPEDTLGVWEMMLGKYGFYSACDFDPKQPTMTLQDAAAAKVRAILGLLGISPENSSRDLHFADLGCGWGAMVAGALDAGLAPQNITAITTSPHQLKMLRTDSRFAGVQAADFDIIQGGLLPGYYDAILTIGGVEHSPPEDMQRVFETWAAALKPGGKIVLEFFCDNKSSPYVRYDHPGISQTSLLAQLVFTGATVRDMPHYRAAWQGAGLEEARHSLQKLDSHCYARTMRAWADNLEQHKADILNMNNGLGVWNHLMTYLILGEWVFRNEMFETWRVVLKRR